MQIEGSIWKTGYNTPLQLSISEHTKRLITHPRPKKRHSDFKEHSQLKCLVVPIKTAPL